MTLTVPSIISLKYDFFALLKVVQYSIILYIGEIGNFRTSDVTFPKCGAITEYQISNRGFSFFFCARIRPIVIF